ncbi:Uncharacterised protein [Providencia alcalifaciens]|nr:Uncharacterised protein [Providencia alcalifaciens]
MNEIEKNRKLVAEKEAVSAEIEMRKAKKPTKKLEQLERKLMRIEDAENKLALISVL